ncbi:hypothetical protein B0H17DRAFT_995277 [Mycena rosella]|uniref:DEP domain-containing protein n=1 Tax=Mycena rosella TaxID=1033263 RepID=A0AAD7FNI8_MYCRO|nr:hypothetical protein B0H17DRAFT_995277 [Mycena rosella]
MISYLDRVVMLIPTSPTVLLPIIPSGPPLANAPVHANSSSSTIAATGPGGAKPKRSAASIVYPTMLLLVADAFRQRVPRTDHVKDGMKYRNVFNGPEAVDRITHIIKMTDRNLVLLFTRALDVQKFFHEVTYDHRLRDSIVELYEFRMIWERGVSTGAVAEVEEESRLPSGVFTLLVDCYGPTCSRDQLCYSIVCPWHLEQQEIDCYRPLCLQEAS